LTQNIDNTVDSANASLAGATLHALKWRYTGAVLQGGLQFVIGVALARLLTPEDFGIVGIALIATGFGRLVGDFGFGAAIIQFPVLTQTHVRAALTGTLLMSALLFVALWFAAPVMGYFFAQDALIPMLRMIGISVIFSGMSVTVVALLRRELRFRTLSAIESSSYLIGFGVVGTSMALLGHGAWSLVAANIIQPLCLLLLGLYFINKPIWLHLHMKEYRDLYRFASAEALNNMVNFAAENLQFVIIGKWLGPASLGLYNRSFHLMDLPVRYFSVALSSVMFPIYARIQTDIPRLGGAFLRTIALTALITVPVFLTMAAAPEIVIGGLFGEQWKSAARAFQILCFGGPFMAMMRVFGAVSHARGFVFNECGRQLIYLVFMTSILWLLLPFGMEGVALAVTISIIARYFLLAHLSLKIVRGSWAEFFSAQLPGYVLGIIVAIAVYLVSSFSGFFVSSDVLQLFLIVAVAAASLALIFLVFPIRWLGELYPWLVTRLAPGLPHWLREFIVSRSVTDVT
jgi:O-antigen/teichoic acid export membrane protein